MRSTLPVEAPFRTDETGLIFLTGACSGKRLSACVDTGAGPTYLSKRMASRLGAALQPYPKGKERNHPSLDIGFGYLKCLRIGSLEVVSLPFHVLDTDFMNGKIKTRTDMILGRDFFRPYRTKIDYPAGNIVFGAPSRKKARNGLLTKKDAGVARYTVTLPFTELCHLIMIRGRVGKRRLRVCVDTGAGGTVISYEAARSLGIRLQKEVAFGSDALRDIPSRFGTLRDLRLGHLHIPSLGVWARDMAPMNKDFGGEVDLILGRDVFGALEMTIDYRHRQLSFSFEKPVGKNSC